ncbi:aldehyde dehydrogenase [Sphingobium sp. AR-3-1]|jgi:aldehyde dehydrogenase|uniref:Aldehyde dehydrogenase n=5 Tax=Pseudomonadota TaxID=1224 RepID=A0A0J7XJU4_9SPHN|nr:MULTISPECIES: aldehyde dehydrogenase family protein [Sphingobium]ETI65120.1 aldehyde dehydrogenase [Sphingobium sp. C100]KMS52311.1 aldehyde dehydrogenase [Sphingobium cupriresistens LL01]MDX3909480.1 aldehyde dehydrogenase family protein [Sphingobium sp.]NML11541.1 aldehyde dehydrogenase [Sphingobium psychrophilum]WCP15709.1 Aldehyde dehydrogenase B [Sphingobium sp. AntQ-1]|tara:strand:- start:8896 stop:10416 length:1521 start_codon:yes stop_codon:yes gene_type:complete
MFQQAIDTVRAKGHAPSRYGNFIGGRWVEPIRGEYFTDHSPINGRQLAEIAKSSPEDVEAALDAAHRAKEGWARMCPAERARILNRVADRLEDNLELLALAETMDNGKPIRETRAADVPLAIDHFRYFAGCVRAEEGSISTIDEKTIAYHFREPLGVVGQIIPWNFPLLMAAWKIAPALAAGNCTVIKPASQTPLSLLLFAELTADILPPGVVNIVTGPGGSVGRAIAANPRIAKVSFTGETTTGRQIMGYAAEHLIPQTMELGGKSPNIFLADVMNEDDNFLDKALEGFALFAFNKGEVCTCPSRALVHESIFDRFVERAVARVAAIRVGDPLDPLTQMGAQASEDQLHKILGYIDIGKQEGAECLTGGQRARPGGELDDGFFVEPTVFVGNNKMRIFQEEIFGPVLSVTPFKTIEDAISIANDTIYGLGAGVWTRNGNHAYRLGRAIEAGRVWTNCYHAYPAHAAFGGYKASGFGRENHKMMLDHYQQTKNLLVSYDETALGLF